jgi:hypothetical protein
MTSQEDGLPHGGGGGGGADFNGGLRLLEWLRGFTLLVETLGGVLSQQS